MPSIQEAIQRYQNLLAAGKGKPVSPEPESSPNLPAPVGIGQLGPSRGTFIPGQVLDTDVAKHNIIGVPERSRMFPIPPTPPVNKTVQNITNTTVQEAASLELEVNGVKNPDQTVLNLVQGSGMQITVDGAGGVNFVSLASGDGLSHGDAVWEIDPAYVWLRDDFLGWGGLNGGPGFQSQLPWRGVLISPGQPSFPAGLPYAGALCMVGTGTSANSSILFLGDNESSENASVYFPNSAMPLFDTTNWKMVWVFAVGRAYELIAATGSSPTVPAFNFTQASFYLGLGNLSQTGVVAVSTIPRPPYFCGLRFDTDTTAPSIGDTTFHFECVSNYTNSITRAGLNAQGNTANTGMSPIEGHVYRFEILCTTAGQVTMTLTDGTAGTSFSAAVTMPKASGSINTVFSSNGLGYITPVTSSGVPFTGGSKMTVSGIAAGPGAIFNGNWVLTAFAGGHFGIIQPSALASTAVTGTISGYPGMMPYMAFGTDSSASPVINAKAVFIDFFSFVWNPEVGGGTGSPNTSKARYF